jgi:hypothetical protein
MEEDDFLEKVPFREQEVNAQAKIYADQGRKLRVRQGAYFLWSSLFCDTRKDERVDCVGATVP